MQNKNNKLKNYKNNKGSLLFFFLVVGAEREEVEVQATPSATRWRSGIPWPLGGDCSGGLR